MSDLLFHIEGERAEETAAELQTLIGELFGQLPRREMSALHPNTDDKAELSLIVAVATLIFAIPPGVESAGNLAERMALKEKIQRLIAFAQQKRQSQQTRIRLKRRNRIEPLPLDETELSALLDQFINPE